MLLKIRSFFLTVVITTLFVCPASAQYKFQYLSVSSGQDAVSSGITGIALFTSSSAAAEFMVQPEHARFIYGLRTSGRVGVIAGGIIGHFQEAPYVGLNVTAGAPLGRVAGIPMSVGAVLRPALFVWEPRDWKNNGTENPEPLYTGIFGGVSLNIGPFGLSYYMLDFLDEPLNELPGASVALPVGNDLSVAGSATWNNNAEKWMLWMGITWSPK